MAEKTVSNDFYPIPQTPLSDKKIQLTYDPINGDVILYTTVAVNGVQTGKTEIYKNALKAIEKIYTKSMKGLMSYDWINK